MKKQNKVSKRNALSPLVCFIQISWCSITVKLCLHKTALTRALFYCTKCYSIVSNYLSEAQPVQILQGFPRKAIFRIRKHASARPYVTDTRTKCTARFFQRSASTVSWRRGLCSVGIKPANSADAVSSDREHTNRRSVPLCPLARTALPPSLSLSACLPFTLLLSDRSLLPLLVPSSIAEAGPSYISAQLEHAVHCCLSYSPTAVRHPCRLSNPFQVRLHSHQHSHKTMVEYAVERLQKKNVHKIFN
jgi:hypothetical protein